MDVIILYKTTPLLPMKITEKHVAQIEAACGGTVSVFGSEEELIASGKTAPVLLTWGGSGKMPETWCNSNASLEWVHSLSAGIDPLTSSSISKLPIKITSSSGIHGLGMSEHVLGTILAWNRRFFSFAKMQQAHIWGKGKTEPIVDTAGQTVGIIGAGNIGKAVAQKCKLVGMNTIGLRRHPVPTEGFDRMLGNDDLPVLLSESDFVVLVTPLTEATRGMIGENEFRQMKKNCLFINIGRGAVVQTDALIKAVKEKWIAGAAIDAFETEPLPEDSPIWDLENMIVSPHTAAVSPGNAGRAIDIFCENIKKFQNGEKMLNLYS